MCARACACVRARVCVCACVRECVRACARVRARACVWQELSRVYRVYEALFAFTVLHMDASQGVRVASLRIRNGFRCFALACFLVALLYSHGCTWVGIAVGASRIKTQAAQVKIC